MKRDMELIRDILLVIESHGDSDGFEVRVEGRTPAEIVYHSRLLKDAEFILGDVVMRDIRNSATERFLARRLTWEGHEFLDNARSPEVWSKATKRVTSTVGTVSLAVLTAVLIEVAKEKLGLR